ncbi:MAG: FAD-dependent oxidoreductase [Planctomycetaceae bacterium]
MHSAVQTESLIVGGGLAGTVLAWRCFQRGERVTLLYSSKRAAASSVAAGLMMPISGRWMKLDPDYPNLLEVAQQFYVDVQETLESVLFESIEIQRKFYDESERALFETERYRKLRELVEVLPDGSGFLMPGARLNVPRFLSASRRWFSESGCVIEATLSAETPIEFAPEEVRIPSLGLTSRRVFFCTGAHDSLQDLFPGVPNHPVHGEILRIRLPEKLECDTSVCRHWVTPVHSGEEETTVFDYLVGATFDREHPGQGPTRDGSLLLLRSAADLLQLPLGSDHVMEHQWGIRAAMKNRRVLIQRHRTYPQAAALNGLGSRGSLLAPTAARDMLNIMDQQPEQQKAAPAAGTVNLTAMAHTSVRRRYRSGDWLLDATAGNGHDTLFLAGLGEPSRVIAVDIQQTAIRQTQQRLADSGLQGVTLYHAEHAMALGTILDEGLVRDVGAVMFNLGYLPRSDHQLITRAETTIPALRHAIDLLRPGGVLTVLAYRGHSGGSEEAESVDQFFSETQAGQVSVIPGNTDDSSSPVLFLFQKSTSVNSDA